ncbi:DUF4158 domain-containing protein [Streptomyces avidinii]|uniref:DUF4158 domain-containing protein n=1 Tax=Streptomyces avidinii TaxID=1895 RepID=UPI0037B78BE5
MTSIERTAYPRFKRLVSAHELHLFFAPTREEAAWAAERMDADGDQLALLLALKSYQQMGRFPRPEEYPEAVVDFVRRAVELPEATPVRWVAVRRCGSGGWCIRRPLTASVSCPRPGCKAGVSAAAGWSACRESDRHQRGWWGMSR